jgi:hypothetical protein
VCYLYDLGRDREISQGSVEGWGVDGARSAPPYL